MASERGPDPLVVTGGAVVDTRSGTTDPLSRDALQREIEANRRAEFRLLLWTASSLLAVAILIVVRVLWL